MSNDNKFVRSIGLFPAQLADSRSGHRVFKNAYWYDQHAHRVGTGDILDFQPAQVAAQLGNGQLLAILPSNALTMQTNFSEKRKDDPGHRFIARRFAVLIMPRCVYLQGPDGSYKEHPALGELPTVSEGAALSLMLAAQKASNALRAREEIN